MSAHGADPAMRNRLANARSPFLLHGATQPVDWWPWSDDAFRHAREQNRPVLLDIGAVWCHWCHVMDRESYEDDETATLINERFIPVKVDRDERPDVDARYQRAVQVLTGQGGWPLTAFLTPEGDVFYGGTYFPPDERHGRPSFRRVLREVARIWSEERDRAVDAARGIQQRLTQHERAEVERGQPRPQLIEETIEELAQSFDFRWGGFGRAPKFPNAGGCDLLLDHAAEHRTVWAGRIVSETLHAMGKGGIWDQLGGGFHRYSTDARWIIPHFEKMAYDNGPLLATIARAHSVTGDPFFAQLAAGIVAHYRDITSELVADGGFPASQDADFSPTDDGDYWTWTEAELREALPDARDFAAASLHFGLDDPAGAMHIDPSRHVLFQAKDAAAVARALELPEPDVEARLARVRATLKAVRDQRPRPYVDTTLYAGWMALVAAGHLAAARFVDVEGAADAALRALERLWNQAFVDGKGLMHRVADADSGYGLEDQAFALLAFLDAAEFTQAPEWLARANTIAAVLLTRFRDDGSGAFRDRPGDASAAVPALERPFLPVSDAPTPSGNGAAALGLLRLAATTGDEAPLAAANAVLGAFAGSAARLLSAAATWMKALSWSVLPVTTVAILDDVETPQDSTLFRAALRSYRPRTLIRWLRGTDTAALPAALRAIVTGARPRAYVCAGQVCAAPVQSAPELEALLRTFRAD